jgi:hypothetical protein
MRALMQTTEQTYANVWNQESRMLNAMLCSAMPRVADAHVERGSELRGGIQENNTIKFRMLPSKNAAAALTPMPRNLCLSIISWSTLFPQQR